MKIGRIALILVASAMVLASCGVEKSTQKGTPSQDGVTSATQGGGAPVVVPGNASEF